MRINHNVPALKTLHQLSISNNSLQKTLEKLSSGSCINRSSDNAAGLAISQKINTQTKGLEQASRNGWDGISMIQTAEGALNEVHEMLIRIKELAVQAGSGTYDSDDRAAANEEATQLMEQIDKIAKETEFNGITLFNGELENGTYIHVGANQGQSMLVEIADVTIGLNGLGFMDDTDPLNPIPTADTIDLSTQADALHTITVAENAISKISEVRGKLGAYQNRLEHTIMNLDVAAENMTESYSRIMDTDMALEMANYTKENILIQAGTSMLAQANQRPQSVLQLLQR